jgi:putative membrane protein
MSGGLLSGLVRGRDPHDGVGEPPDPRFTFANERTFLAWNRTALALITAGFAVIEFVDFSLDWMRFVLGIPLILIGGILALTSYRSWDHNERCMRLDQPLPYPRMPRTLAVAVGVVAVIAVVAIAIDALFG